MSEFTGVGLGVKSPDLMAKLSGLLSVKQQQQQLRAQTAEASGAEQTQNQRAGLAQYMKGIGKHTGEDGTLDLNSVANDTQLAAVAGDQYLDVIGKMAAVKSQQLEAKDKLVGLRNDQRAAFSDMMGALRSNKDVAENTDKGKQLVNQALEQYGQMYGEDVLPVLSAYAGPLKHSPDLPATLKAIQQQGMSASAQAAAQQPSFTDTGKQLKQTGTGAAPTADLDKTVSPNAIPLKGFGGETVLVDPSTNTAALVGEGRGGQAPKKNPFTQPAYTGQAEDIATAQHDVQNIRTTADQAPVNRNIYQHILKLADDTTTGQLPSFFQKNAVIGQMFGDKYQELNKYLEKNAIANMQAMGGPPSDARLSAAVAANGGTQFNAKALKAVTRFNYATNTGLENFRNGIDKAIGTEKQDYSKLPQFRADWAKNFDVKVFILENALKDGDEQTKAALLNEMSPEEAKDLTTKMKNLDALSSKGHL